MIRYSYVSVILTWGIDTHVAFTLMPSVSHHHLDGSIAGGWYIHLTLPWLMMINNMDNVPLCEVDNLKKYTT